MFWKWLIARVIALLAGVKWQHLVKAFSIVISIANTMSGQPDLAKRTAAVKALQTAFTGLSDSAAEWVILTALRLWKIGKKP